MSFPTITLPQGGAITLKVRSKADEAKYQAALQVIAATLSLENLQAVAQKCQKHGADKMNSKLKQGLTFL